MSSEENNSEPPRVLQIFRRRITSALERVPISEHGEELMVLTPFETPNHETINLHIRHLGDALEMADGGTLASHFEGARASLESPPLGVERLLRYYDCSMRNGELVRATTNDTLVGDALEFMMAIAAIGGLTTGLASKSSNPFPTDVRNQLKERGYGVGPGRIDVSDFLVHYDVNYEPRNIAMQCVGGPETRISNPEREIRKAIDRLLEIEKFTSKEGLLILDSENDWWHKYEVPLRKVADKQIMNGEPLYEYLGAPE